MTLRKTGKPVLTSLALAVFCAPWTAFAMNHHETSPSASCKEISISPDATEGVRDEPVSVPGEYNNIARSTKTVMTIEALGGAAVCFSVIDWNVVEQFWISGDGRFFGFHTYGMEADGHHVIDRAGSGAILATGVRPAFSDDATMFASAQRTAAGWGNLEGLGIWKIDPDGTQMVYEFTNGLLEGLDWRIDNWVGNNEIRLTVASSAAVVASDLSFEEELEQAERLNYRLIDRGSGWKLEEIE